MSEGDKRSLQWKDQCSKSFLLIGLHFLTDYYVLNGSRKLWTCLENETLWQNWRGIDPHIVSGSPLIITWQRKYTRVIDMYLINNIQSLHCLGESDFRKLSIILLKSCSSDNSIYINTFILQWLWLKRYCKMFCFLNITRIYICIFC